MIRALLFTLFAATSAGVAVQDEPYDFKGIKLGSDIAAIQGDARFSCGRSGEVLIGDTICRLKYDVKETVAGVPVQTLSLRYYGDKLLGISVYFHPRNFNTVSAALQERYGAPASNDRETVSTRNGQKYEQVTMLWHNSVSHIRLKRYAGDVTTSSLNIDHFEMLREFERRKQEKVKKGSSDL